MAESDAKTHEEYQEEIARLKKINDALITRVERSTDQQGNAYSLFQTAIGLEEQVRHRTQQLSNTLNDLEMTNHQLLSAKETAEQANQSKTRFLAAASHDVLQPLNAALLSMSTLSAVQHSSQGRDLCRQVEHSLETMDELLRTLLYMSRLDTGDIKPHWQTVSLDALFDSIAADFSPVADFKSLDLRVRHSGLHVWSDPTMLRRLLQNIVTNALRYTRYGGALLIAGRLGDRVHIRIADTGIGIPKDRFDEIFVEFQRFDAPAAGDSNSSGLGLGLAIVDRMVKTLDHDLCVNSRVGHGSCFSLFLDFCEPPAPQTRRPQRDTQASSESQVKTVTLTGARILVLENDLAALQALEALLKQWGCELRLASSTTEALGALDNEPDWRPDLLIADQHLDNAERGSTAVRMIRQRLVQEIPAVIVTANPSDRLWRLADQGRLEVMPKPVKPAQLRALLSHMRAEGSSADIQQPE